MNEFDGELTAIGVYFWLPSIINKSKEWKGGGAYQY
jgi:hypothetical protein